MPSGDGRWAELASHNERIIRPDDPEISSAATARWDELASNWERLVDTSEPVFHQATGGHASTGMRLVASAA